MDEKESKKIVVFGESQLASLAHFYFKHDSIHEVVAFTVDHDYRSGDSFKGFPIVDFESVHELYPPSEFVMFLPISFKRMNYLRR